jgi:alkanesulfonate monooxygenase SsuD/methylene tetrahydromethanopterin reductase-like flavin-dependent oxidoreductase (luciferase family)
MYAHLLFDSRDQPHIVYGFGEYPGLCLETAYRDEKGWHHETIDPAWYNGRNLAIAGWQKAMARLFLGWAKPKTMHLTAKYTDEWNVSSTGIARYCRLVEAFERACVEVGRDPATVTRAWGGGYIVRPVEADARRIGG